MSLQNLRHALRLLPKNIGVTAVALLTLAIGIGASTAVFSVAYAVLLKPLPYNQPGDIVRRWELNASGHRISFADPNFEDIRSQSRSLAGAAEFLLCFVRFVHTPACPPPPLPNRNYNSHFIAKGLISRLRVAFSLGAISFRETA